MFGSSSPEKTISRDLELLHILTRMDQEATREGGRNQEQDGGLNRQTGAWRVQLAREKDRLGKDMTVREKERRADIE